MAILSRPPYQGPCRRLVIAFDIGTTFSGISYSILDPGNVPEIRPVTRFPSQECAGGNLKIPSVTIYNGTHPEVFGAATLQDGIDADIEENGWNKAYWYKLRLRPETSVDVNSDLELPPLPPGLTIVRIFADFMTYLFHCTKTFIVETHSNKLWDSLQGNITFVLTHPNGWGGPQQARMREAAILAKLIPNTAEGRERIKFVTEGEASLHFCLSNGLEVAAGPEGNESEGSGIVIVDAGGGTIDVTTYRATSSNTFEEIAAAKCYFYGAAVVSMKFHKHLREKLGGTRFEADIPTIVNRFDRNTKHVFRRDDQPHHIQFASARDRDPALNIRGGRIMIEGNVVAQFFQPSIDCIVDAIRLQQFKAHFPVKSVFLVGGFSASDWVFEKVKEQVEPLGIQVSRPDTQVNKAVADGAISFYLDDAVTSRVARSTYGIKSSRNFVFSDPKHIQRAHLMKTHQITGIPILPDRFASILLEDTRVEKTKEFRQRFSLSRKSPSELDCIKVDILYYTGEKEDPAWISDEPDMFPTICSIQADTSRVQKEASVWGLGNYYYSVSFDVVLLFGLTELKAQIAYKENGVEKRGPATVLYDEVVYETPSVEEGQSLWG